jgi:hypothetical protein
MRYELKTWPKLFSAILANFKRHEIPVNDRDFREGDELFLEGIGSRYADLLRRVRLWQ